MAARSYTSLVAYHCLRLHHGATHRALPFSRLGCARDCSPASLICRPPHSYATLLLLLRPRNHRLVPYSRASSLVITEAQYAAARRGGQAGPLAAVVTAAHPVVAAILRRPAVATLQHDLVVIITVARIALQLLQGLADIQSGTTAAQPWPSGRVAADQPRTPVVRLLLSSDSR